jgi:hypothetical protein
LESTTHPFIFNNTIQTDGHTADIMLYKAKKVGQFDPTTIKQVAKVSIEDPVDIVGIDPGRRFVYTVSFGHGEKEHEVRRFSTKEYYHITSVPVKKVPDELFNTPTAKTFSINKYLTSQVRTCIAHNVFKYI